MHQEREISFLLNELEIKRKDIKRRFPAVERVSSSLVQIVPYEDGKRNGRASSFVIEGGRLVTAWHVVKKADEVILHPSPRDSNFSTRVSVKEATLYPELDIAIFPLPEVYEDFLPAIHTSDCKPSDNVFVIGYPRIDRSLLWEYYNRQPTIHYARVVSKENGALKMLSPDFFWKEVGGMSGGVVADHEGKAVGIMTAYEHFSDFHAYRISATDINTFNHN